MPTANVIPGRNYFEADGMTPLLTTDPSGSVATIDPRRRKLATSR